MANAFAHSDGRRDSGVGAAVRVAACGDRSNCGDTGYIAAMLLVAREGAVLEREGSVSGAVFRGGYIVLKCRVED